MCDQHFQKHYEVIGCGRCLYKDSATKLHIMKKTPRKNRADGEMARRSLFRADATLRVHQSALRLGNQSFSRGSECASISHPTDDLRRLDPLRMAAPPAPVAPVAALGRIGTTLGSNSGFAGPVKIHQAASESPCRCGSALPQRQVKSAHFAPQGCDG